MNFSKYIGLSYKHKGRDFNGVDCYGIPYLTHKEEKKVILPDFTGVDYFGTWYERGEQHIKNNIKNIRHILKEVNKPYISFDIMLFYSSPSKIVVNHCGIFIGDNKLLHINEYGTAKSEVVRFSGYWESKLYKVIRYKGDT